MPRRRKAAEQGNSTAIGREPDGARTGQPFTSAESVPGDPMGLLAMQRLVGNRAVMSVVARTTPTSPAPRSVSRPPGLTIQRLWSKKDFKQNTDAGLLSSRGDTLKAIEELLDRYHSVQSDPATQAGFVERISILDQVTKDCELWIANHTGDTSRSRKRMPGMLNLKSQAELQTAYLRSHAPDPNQIPTKDEHNEGNTLAERFESGSPNSALQKLGCLVDLAAPNQGSQGQVDLEIDFRPIEPSGVAFIQLRLQAKADRQEKNKLKIRTEIAVGGGADIGNVARLKAELGGYMEVQGTNSEECMQLLSYGLYRRFRESQVLPRGIANFMWGGSTSDAIGYKRAEKWSAAVEKSAMGKDSSGKDKDTYVESGLFGGGVAEVGLEHVGKGKFQTQVGGGTRYNKKGIDAITGVNAKDPSKKRGRAKFGEVHDRDQLPGWGLGKAQGKRGEHTAYWNTSAEIDFGVGTIGAKLEMSWSSAGRDKMRASHLREWKIELKGGVKIPAAKLVAGDWFWELVGQKAVSSLSAFIRTAAEEKEKGTKARVIGTAIPVAEDGAHILSQLAKAPTEAFKPNSFKAPDSIIKEGVSGTSALLLIGDLKCKYDYMYAAAHPDEPPKRTNYEINFQIADEKQLKVEAIVARAAVKTLNRIIRLQIKDGAFTVD